VRVAIIQTIGAAAALTDSEIDAMESQLLAVSLLLQIMAMMLPDVAPASRAQGEN